MDCRLKDFHEYVKSKGHTIPIEEGRFHEFMSWYAIETEQANKTLSDKWFGFVDGKVVSYRLKL